MCPLAMTNVTEHFSADGAIYWRSGLVRDYMTGMSHLVFLSLTLTRRGVWRNGIKLKKERITLITIGFWNRLLSETYAFSYGWTLLDTTTSDLKTIYADICQGLIAKQQQTVADALC